MELRQHLLLARRQFHQRFTSTFLVQNFGTKNYKAEM